MKPIVHRIKVKEIRHHNPETFFTVLIGTKMKRNSAGNFVKTKESNTYIGYFTAVYPNDQISVTCEKVHDRFYGDQLNILCYQRMIPGTIEDMEEFLVSHVKGLGRKKAAILIDRYGMDVISVVRDDPYALDCITLSPDSKRIFREEILANDSFEELLTMLLLYHIDHRFANVLFSRYGNDAVLHLKNNPYGILTDGLLDFASIEKIAFHEGISEDDPNRIYGVFLSTLRTDSESNGNLYLKKADLQSRCSEYILQSRSPYALSSFSEEQLTAAITTGIASGVVSVDYRDPDVPIYLTRNLLDENGILDGIERIRDNPKKSYYTENSICAQLAFYQALHHIKLAPAQVDAVKMALTNPISIITGGPGTGKTQTINTLISSVLTISPNASIKLAAPTGKAAVRMKEITGRNAQTLHRMLGIFQNNEDRDREINCDILIVDEFSMVDAYLCNKLLHKISEQTRVVLVGDFHQLPSVGPGLVLRDLIESGKIPTTTLSQIFRQAETSGIVSNSSGLFPVDTQKQPVYSKTKTGDFYFLDADSTDKALELIQRAINNLQKNRGFSLDQIQVLSPIHDSALGVDKLNMLFQDSFNPSVSCVEYKEKEFRIGDRVIHIQNNYDLGVVNGEIGVVTAFGPDVKDILTVEYPGHDDPVHYAFSDLSELELAYAVTIHKSQGSEFPVVILPVTRLLEKGLNVNSIYTAWTRAKKVVVMVGDRRVLGRAVKRSVIAERNSKLSEKLKQLP